MGPWFLNRSESNQQRIGEARRRCDNSPPSCIALGPPIEVSATPCDDHGPPIGRTDPAQQSVLNTRRLNRFGRGGAFCQTAVR
eukprot:14886523-Alexandrium_andersonii.AAC.1